MKFKKYQHLERFGTTEVENIELGKCYIFPKLDGTNASIWLGENGKIQAGSRRRQLTLDKDNADFYKWVLEQDNILSYLENNPKHRLYGEWLVPHSLKTYKDNAWRNFYVFDVVESNNESDDIKYIKYDDYLKELEKYNISYIPCISVIDKPSYDQLINQLNKNTYLIQDGKGNGEGIVIKNYEYVNQYNRTVWAKIVTSEFKEKHIKEMGYSEIKGKKIIEEEIAKEFVTTALVEKVYSKIENEHGFSSSKIPDLLNNIFYDVVKEDTWTICQKYKNPTIDFKRLQLFVFKEVRLKKSNLF